MTGFRTGYVLAGAMTLLATMLLAGGAAQAQNQSNIQYDCDRACLTGFIDAFVDGLLANDSGRVPLAPDAKVTLNDDIMPLADTFWAEAQSVRGRVDIANPRLGDTGTQMLVVNEDGAEIIHVFRLKVKDGAITEVEQIRTRGPEEGSLYDTSTLREPNPNFNIAIRPAEQDSYYDLIAAAESYWRAFNTNGTDEYRPAEFWPYVPRLENGVLTTHAPFAGNPPSTAAEQFDLGRHAGRNIWDIRYPVVDEEYGVVMSFARFGLKDGATPRSEAQSVDRLVAEFFAIRKGLIWDIQAVMFNRDDSLPSAWAPDYGPTRGGWAPVTCDRACLTVFIDAYYDALLANDPARLPQAAGARITLNGKDVTLAEAFWDGAERVRWRFDAVNERLGDTGTQVVVVDGDGEDSMEIVRLKVAGGAITEIEIIRTFEGEAGAWWGPEQLDPEPSAFLTLPIPPVERDSYYKLVAVADGYFRAFQTNGTPDYHRPALLPDTRRFENGAQFTANYRNGVYVTAMDGFDRGLFIGRNLWDRRHAVVDEERGIVLTILRFGRIDGPIENASSVTAFDRLVGEFFTVKAGKIQEVQAVMFDLDDDEPTGWGNPWYGPGKGGWGAMPTGQ